MEIVADNGEADVGEADGGLEPSGVAWLERFPDSGELSALQPAFGAACARFIEALTTAGASVEIGSSRRPAERAYLMHFAYHVANELLDPSEVPAKPGVAIGWVHATLDESRAAARQMVAGYRIVHEPALKSRHTEGRAIDLTISWLDPLRIADADGNDVDLDGPGDGTSEALHDVGASYGVHKLDGDRPHWSDDGH